MDDQQEDVNHNATSVVGGGPPSLPHVTESPIPANAQNSAQVQQPTTSPPPPPEPAAQVTTQEPQVSATQPTPQPASPPPAQPPTPSVLPNHPSTRSSGLSNPMNTPPTLTTPTVQVGGSYKTRGSYRSGPKLGSVIGAVFTLFVLMFGGLFGFGVMVAYGQISLSNEDLQSVIQRAVFQLPFMPKTPLFVLESMIAAHEDVRSAHIDASLATEAKTINDVLGTQSFDMVISGDVDVSDESYPKAKLNFKLTNEFDADLIVMDKSVYARVNKLPQVIAGMFIGLAGDDVSLDPLLSQWVWFDTSELETDAREALEENREEEEMSEEMERFFKRLTEEVLMKNLQMKSDEVDGTPVYRLEVDLSSQDIDEIAKIYEEEVDNIIVPGTLDTDEIKASDVFKQVKLSIYVLKKEYYLRKATIFVSADNSAYVSQYNSPDSIVGPLSMPEQETFDVAFSLGLTQVGESLNIRGPEDFMNTEEFVAKATQLFMEMQTPTKDELELLMEEDLSQDIESLEDIDFELEEE